ERVLAENACLRITLGKNANNSPQLFEPTQHPTADDPLLPARRQYPTARISQLHQLRELFRGASAGETPIQGQGAVEDRYEIAALRAVIAKHLPLRVAAQEAPDLRNALRLAQEIGARLVFETPYEV